MREPSPQGYKDARVEYDKHGCEVCEALVRIHWANDYVPEGVK